MDRAIEQESRRRSLGRCEYCRIPENLSKLKLVIDHIVARQHGGSDALENLAMACGFCNRHKGPNIAGVDPVTGKMSRLFHPRTDHWIEHFRWDGANLVGLTEVGRVTIVVLAINNPYQLAIRQSLIDEGAFRSE